MRDDRPGALPVRFPLIPQFDVLTVRVQADGHGDDSLTCYMLQRDGSDGPELIVAKPQELRRTFYDGNTLGGTAYVHVGTGERTATADEAETQKITPDYIEGTTNLLVVKPRNGTGVDGVLWIDLNIDGRAWAAEIEAAE